MFNAVPIKLNNNILNKLKFWDIQKDWGMDGLPHVSRRK